MSQGYNRVTLFGNLGADPELRKLPSGKGLLRLRLATNQSWLNKEGVREERTDWHNVVVWGARAEGLAKVLKRGSFLLVEGQLRTHSYEKDGEKRYATDVYADEVVLGGRRRPSGGDADPHDAAMDMDADTRSDGDVAAEMRAEAEMHARGGRNAPPDEGSRPIPESGRDEPEEPEESEPSPAHPTRPRGGQGGNDGSAEAPIPPAPSPRRRTRSPAPLSAMASAA